MRIEVPDPVIKAREHADKSESRRQHLLAALQRETALAARYERLRADVEALCDPSNDGPRPYAVPIDGDVLLAVGTDNLRAILARRERPDGEGTQ